MVLSFQKDTEAQEKTVPLYLSLISDAFIGRAFVFLTTL